MSLYFGWSLLHFIVGEESIPLGVWLYDGGDHFEIGNLSEKSNEGENGIARNFPTEERCLIAIIEVAHSILHKGDVQMCLHCLNGHQDEATELEHCCQCGNEDQLVFLKVWGLEVLNLHHQCDQCHCHLHCNVKSVLVCQVVQGIVLSIFDSCELIDIVNDWVMKKVQAMCAKALRRNSASSQICLLSTWGGRMVWVLASRCSLR